MRRYRTIATLVCAASAGSGCARAPRAALEPTAVELAPAPPRPEASTTLPPHPSPCVISGNGEPTCDPEEPEEPFDVYEASTGNRPIAKVRFPSAVAMSWSGFVNGQKLARVEIQSRGLELSGLAQHEARRFSLLRAVEVFGPHVVALEGSLVHITAVSGGLASIAIETQLSEPRTLDTTIDCSELVHGCADEGGPAVEDDSKPQLMELTGERLVLYNAPGETPLLTVRGPTSPPDYPTLVASRDGYARIRDRWGALLIDAWLSETQVKHRGLTAGAASIPVGPGAPVPAAASSTAQLYWGPGKPIVIQVATVLRRASISVGQRPGRAVGSLNPETVVRVLTARGGALGVRLQDVYVEPPDGQYFWIEQSALSATREAVVDE